MKVKQDEFKNLMVLNDAGRIIGKIYEYEEKFWIFAPEHLYGFNREEMGWISKVLILLDDINDLHSKVIKNLEDSVDGD